MTGSARNPWRRALPYATASATLILALMLTWFTFRNRYVVFLYYHNMGPTVPATGPFSPVTRSRYWMTGLVAGGAVLALMTVVHLLRGRVRPARTPPAWWRIWLLTLGPLLIGVPAITMLTDSPRLPLWLAALTAASTLAGLALALLPGALVARHPLDAALLGLDGVALALWLTILPSLEHVAAWIARGRRIYLLMLIVVPVAGLFGLVIVSLIRAWLRRPVPSTRALALAGLIVAYLGLPFTHHTLATAGRFYITDMDNFFARDPAVQAFTFFVTGALIWLTTRLRKATRQSHG